jgi:hypothetical protein
VQDRLLEPVRCRFTPHVSPPPVAVWPAGPIGGQAETDQRSRRLGPRIRWVVSARRYPWHAIRHIWPQPNNLCRSTLSLGRTVVAVTRSHRRRRLASATQSDILDLQTCQATHERTSNIDAFLEESGDETHLATEPPNVTNLDSAHSLSTNSQGPRRSHTTHAMKPHQSGTQFMVAYRDRVGRLIPRQSGPHTAGEFDVLGEID